VKRFLQEAGGHHPETACFAVAGPVQENVVVLTNIQGWTIDGFRLEQDLDIKRVKVINDFSGIGYGLLTLEDSECRILNRGEHKPRAPIICVGAGTGLGECFLTFDGSQYEVFATEGGHSDFAPHSQLEFELVEFVIKKHNLVDPRISVERVVSGGGIANIYEFLRFKFPERANKEVSKEFDEATIKDKPAVVSKSTDRCSIANQAIEMFLEAYGSEVGNCALKFLPRGGIYIAGGLMPKLLSRVEGSKFMEAFRAKGRMSGLTAQMPLKVVQDEFIGLRGAKLVACRLLNETSLTIDQNQQGDQISSGAEAVLAVSEAIKRGLKDIQVARGTTADGAHGSSSPAFIQLNVSEAAGMAIIVSMTAIALFAIGSVNPRSRKLM
jgi:glucokinase